MCAALFERLELQREPDRSLDRYDHSDRRKFLHIDYDALGILAIERPFELSVNPLTMRPTFDITNLGIAASSTAERPVLYMSVNK